MLDCKRKNKGNSLPLVYAEQYYHDDVTDDLFSLDRNDGDFSFDCEEYQVPRLPLTLDLSAVAHFPAKKKKSPIKLRAKCKAVARSGLVGGKPTELEYPPVVRWHWI